MTGTDLLFIFLIVVFVSGTISLVQYKYDIKDRDCKKENDNGINRYDQSNWE